MLEGQVAVVSGGTRGLGAAAANALLEAGARVAVIGRSAQVSDGSSKRSLSDTKSSETENAKIHLAVDVTDINSLEVAREKILARFKRIDVLVNSAGIAPVATLLASAEDHFVKVLSTNVLGVVNCCKVFGRAMVEQKSGTVINVASIAGMHGEANLTAYCASKGAVIAFTKALAREWASSNVRVNAIAPGYFRTDLTRSALEDPEISSRLLKKIPLRRVGRPDELGPLAVYLASPAAAFMTGSVLVIDGGQIA